MHPAVPSGCPPTVKAMYAPAHISTGVQDELPIAPWPISAPRSNSDTLQSVTCTTSQLRPQACQLRPQACQLRPQACQLRPQACQLLNLSCNNANPVQVHALCASHRPSHVPCFVCGIRAHTKRDLPHEPSKQFHWMMLFGAHLSFPGAQI